MKKNLPKQLVNKLFNTNTLLPNFTTSQVKIVTKSLSISFLLFCIFSMFSCSKMEIESSTNYLIKKEEIKKIRSLTERALITEGSKIIEHEALSNRPYLNYYDISDSSHVYMIIPILNNNKSIKGFVKFKLDFNKKIVNEESYDLASVKDNDENFGYFINIFSDLGYQLNNEVGMFLEKYIEENQKASLANKKADHESGKKSNLKTLNNQEQLRTFVRFNLGFVWASAVDNCPPEGTVAQAMALRDFLSNQTNWYLSQQRAAVPSRQISYFFTDNAVELTAFSHINDSPLGELSTAQSTATLFDQWILYGNPIPSCFTGSLRVRIYGWYQTSNISNPYPGGGDSGYDSNGQVTNIDFLNFLHGRPFTYLPDVPCGLILSWIDLVLKEVNSDEIYKLNTIRTNPNIIPRLNPDIISRIQSINDANSAVINMDYFPIRVNQLPYDGNTRMTAPQFLEHIRTNLNFFVNTTYGHFRPYNYYGIDDEGLWYSNNPKGAVMLIDMMGPDNGSVIVTESSQNKWIFTAIYDPKYGTHPISGNREFGYEQNSDGSYTFYTKAIDRLTTPFHNSMQLIGFGMADALWESFRLKVNNFVNEKGGNASISPADAKTEIKRVDWDKVKKVVNGQLPLNTLSNDC